MYRVIPILKKAVQGSQGPQEVQSLQSWGVVKYKQSLFSQKLCESCMSMCALSLSLQFKLFPKSIPNLNECTHRTSEKGSTLIHKSQRFKTSGFLTLNGVPILYSVAYWYCIVALPDVHNTLVVVYLIMIAYNNNHISEFLSLTAAV